MKNLSKLLKSPSNDSRPWAMWIWNGSITKKEIDYQMSEFSNKGYGGLSVRPGRYMEPPFLSDEFMDLFGYTLSKAKTSGLGIRLSDDFSLIQNDFLQSLINKKSTYRAQCLKLEFSEVYSKKEKLELELSDPDQYLIFSVKENDGKIQLSTVKEIKPAAKSSSIVWRAAADNMRVIVLKRKFMRDSSGNYMPNPFNTEVAHAYIRNVLEPLKESFSKYFSTVFHGIVTEIPACIPNENTIPWEDDLVPKYRTRFKKNMVKIVPLLFFPSEEKDSKSRRHLYGYLINSMYERFAGVLEKWVKRFRISQWVLAPESTVSPANKIPKGCFSNPSIKLEAAGTQNIYGLSESLPFFKALSDMNSIQYRRDTVALIGRSNQGFSSNLQELKTDIETAVINGTTKIIIDGCFFNVSHRNYLRTPYNPSWYFPEWEETKNLCDFAARLHSLTSRTQYKRDVAVILPTESILSEYSALENESETIGNSILRKVITTLERNNISYDLINEDVLLSSSIRTNGEFGPSNRVRKGNYQACILPFTRLINKSLFVFLEKLAVKKSIIIFIDEPPKGNFDDGISQQFTNRVQKILDAKNKNVYVASCREMVQQLKPVENSVKTSSGGKPCPDIYSFHGTTTSEDLYGFFNTSKRRDFFVSVSVPRKKYTYLLDNFLGTFYELKDNGEDSDNEIQLSFAPRQSHYIISSNSKIYGSSNKIPSTTSSSLQPRKYRMYLKDKWTFSPHTLNSVPLSKWNTRIGLSRETGAFSHYSESYFEIKEIPEICGLVLPGINDACWGAPYQSRENRFEISCNGNIIDPLIFLGDNEDKESEDYQLNSFLRDNAFKYNIKKYLNKGYNRIAVRTINYNGDPGIIQFPPLIAGSFSIKKGNRGWIIQSAQSGAGYDSWTKHGFPYFSGTGTYSQQFEVPSECKKTILKLSNTSGICDIEINSNPIGRLLWQPMELDITGKCEYKRNEITIHVMNTTDNIFRMYGRPSGLLDEVCIDVYS